MSSSVTQIEISCVRDVGTDDATLTVTLADGRVISTPLEWYPRLAYGTSQERAHWRLIADGDGIHWPDLDEDISVEGLIAGRKSGEGAPSLKRWKSIQDKLRQMPGELRELRREVLRSGPMSVDDIVRHSHATVAAYDSRSAQWSVVLSAEPFELIRREGMNEESAAVVYEAASPQVALDVKQALLGSGFVGTGEDGTGNDDRYVLIYSKSVM